MDNCAVNNKENNRRCTNAQQLRRDAASASTSARDLSGVVCGWIDSPQVHASSTLISSDQPKIHQL